MTDLDDLFEVLIDESAQRREPVEHIETRARELRRRDRRRHRTQGLLAGAVVIAIAVGSIAIARRGDNESTPAVHVGTTTTTTPLVHVPSGWRTYDYGLARLSIPPGWRATRTCSAPYTLHFDDPSLDDGSCALVPGPAIGVSSFSSSPAPYRPNREVNGIRYELVSPRCLTAECGPTARVEALGVTIVFRWAVDAESILRTLTYSTYARMQQQTFGPTPSTWKTISFDGYSVRVPRAWKTSASSAICRPSPDTAYYSNVRSAAQCVRTLGETPPEDSLQLFGGNAMPATVIGSHHGLQFGRLTAFGPFVHTLAYVVTGGTRSLIVTVGLGLDPAIARGILGSIRTAG